MILSRQSVCCFPEILAKVVVLEFDRRQASSDGGALLLKAAGQHDGLIASMAGCLRDRRQAGKVEHSLRDLPQSFPFLATFRQMALQLGASPGENSGATFAP